MENLGYILISIPIIVFVLAYIWSLIKSVIEGDWWYIIFQASMTVFIVMLIVGASLLPDSVKNITNKELHQKIVELEKTCKCK